MISKSFDIKRGTKQGDPMSPILFGAVLEDIVKPLKDRWIKRRWGVNVNGEYLNNLRFADDILLVASSRKQLASMLRELASASSKVGLQVLQARLVFKYIWIKLRF